MPYFIERSLLIPRAREEVFAFFSNAANLERITPPFLQFRVLTPGPISMKAGTLIDYELKLYGVRFRWKTLIESFDPFSSFVDVQLKGPYRKWHHSHKFEEVPGGTLMHDRVDYDLPFGWLGSIAHAFFVRRSVEQIFDYRNATFTQIFSSDGSI